MPDLTKLILDSNYDTFKQNTIYTGTETISGSTTGGLNTRTFTVQLASTPDMVDVLFNGPADITGIDPRPASAWFKQGAVWVTTNNAGGGNPAGFFLNGTIQGSVLTITALYVQEFLTSETITPTVFGYRVIDYSVF